MLYYSTRHVFVNALIVSQAENPLKSLSIMFTIIIELYKTTLKFIKTNKQT